MYTLKGLGFAMLAIGIACLVAIPWLRANGRADETSGTIFAALLFSSIGAVIVFLRRGRR
jgi:hypothetical protein